jgi:putative glycosyltransferase (TIGR04372 family)
MSIQAVDNKAGPAPAADSKPDLAARYAWVLEWLFKDTSRAGEREFLRNLAFLLLPFKQAFMLAIMYRRHTQNGDLDRPFQYFCGPKVEANIHWMLTSPRSDKYINELLFFLLLSDREKLVLELFPKIDWRRADDYFLEAIAKLMEKLASGYVMEVLTQVHTIDWNAIPPKYLARFSKVMKLMLEHQNFGFEQRTFAGRQIDGETLFEAPLDRYVPEFFCNKALINSLVAQLELPSHDDIIAAREHAGQYWEQLPPNHQQRDVLADINLFYGYRNLLLTTYHSGEGFHVPEVNTKLNETQQRLRRSLPAPSPELKSLLDRLGIELPDVKLLSPDWSALIGHNGHLNVHLMMREMGWWQGSPVMLAYEDRIANKPFLSLLAETCPTLTLNDNVSAGVWYELASLTPFLGVSHQAFAFEDGRSMYWNDAGSMALKEWEGAGRGFPLRDVYDRRLLKDDLPEQLYQSLRKKWGMAKDDWFVCMHVRDSKTRNDTEGAGESIRNASLGTYLDAVRHVTERGGWVVRMGGRKVPPLPEMERVIDYARSEDQVPEMDIHLMRRARMFIGTTSGFAYVATSFGIPTAMVNALSSVGLLWSTDTRFALKHVHTTEGRMLSLGDITSERYRWAFPTFESLKRAGLVVSESSSDEIMETVREVLDLSDPKRTGPAPGVDETWERHVNTPGFFGSSRPSKYFLEKYARELLDSK